MSDFTDHSDDVAGLFDLGAVSAPLSLADRGEQARIWRLETERGVFAVKQALAGFAPRSDGVDVAFQEAVLAQTDVLMPAPVRRPDGSVLAPVAGELVRVAEWVDLRAADPGLDPRRIGALLAALHRVELDVPGEVDPWYWAPVGRSALLRYADRLDDGAAPFAAQFRAAVPGLVELEGLLEAPVSPRLCHCDLWADNLRETTDGDLCVIDWDNCGPADPAHELAMVLFEFGRGSRERTRALYAAYVEKGGPARITRPGQLTMVIAQFGHFWEGAAQGWLDPAATEEDRLHAADRVAELVDPPLTVDLVAETVDFLA